MGRFATGMVCAGALGVLAVFVGCAAGATADDGSLPTQNQNPTDPGGGSQVLGAGTSSSSSGDDGASDDAGITTPVKPKGDGGAKQSDGGITIVDAGPPPPPAPNPGDACTTQDQVVKTACGFCGTKQTICTKNDDGSLTWSVYDSCIGEHGFECVAGTSGTQDCNNCGTRPVTCSTSCTWTAGACSTQAGVGCVPGSWDLTTAGCPANGSGEYRVRQCSATCQEGNYTSSCEAPPTTIEVGPSVGSISSTVAVLGGQLGKIDTYSSCPLSTISSTLVAYAYTQVHNPLAVAATVDVYNSAAPNSTAVTETQITAYDSDVPPATADARKKCLQTSNDGTTALTGNFELASLDGTKKITIPAGQTIIVHTNSRISTAAGPIKVNVKVESLGATP